ncbi:hypothetical protein CPB84DRAFT_1961640 [Gymnopilus junonius]|uniref:F-box domain-containing protein n=1 Tax=Gymnopilus junonius TaxID=109634 RepID=A0A9P5TPV6_GYMJU|nr:hypothetical protein CPB84DRAFT_1961640 [Gymnopilus junonius]
MAETPNSLLDLHDDFDPSQCSMGDEGKQCDACRELEELDTTLRGTYENLTDPSRKRQAMKEKINRLHDPFSRYNLPFELISEIFELFAIDAQPSTSHGRRWLEAEFGAPLLLSSVCRSWREVAFGTPRLWTTMKMILLHTKNIKLRGELIQQWLDRSGQLPLHLLIYDVTYNVTFNDYKLILEAFDAIRGNAFRWRSLTVIAPSSLFPALTQNVSSAPSLRSLAFLRHIGRSTYRFCIPDTPSLNEIRILHSHIKDFSLQWNNLTTFHMETVSLDEIFEVLRQADKLEKCTLLHIVDAKEYFAFPEAPLVHRSLKDLHLKFGGCFYSKLFPLLVLPSLTQLAIEPGDHFPVDEFIFLCRRSNCFSRRSTSNHPSTTSVMLNSFEFSTICLCQVLDPHEADDSECITDRFLSGFKEHRKG